MIDLTTGVPGSGKSAYTLFRIWEKLKAGETRPLFVHGVPDLAIDHVPLICRSATCEHCRDITDTTGYLDAENWHEWAPDGALIWLDEVQHIYRPRATGAGVPVSVAAFETHRHKGLDFYLTTQHPKLLDSNIRRLVSKHIHCKQTALRRIQYEWSECKDDPQSTGDAVQSNYKLPKEVFGLYKSASLHTKLDRRIPTQVYVLVGCLVLGLAASGKFYATMKDRVKGADPVEVSVKENNPVQTGQAVGDPDPVQAQKESPFDYVPTRENIPESAPAYLPLVKVQTFPKLAGCVVKTNEPDTCRCYTQQATPYFVSPDICRSFVKYGKFDAYRPDTGATARGDRGGSGLASNPAHVSRTTPTS